MRANVKIYRGNGGPNKRGQVQNIFRKEIKKTYLVLGRNRGKLKGKMDMKLE